MFVIDAYSIYKLDAVFGIEFQLLERQRNRVAEYFFYRYKFVVLN